MGVAESESGFGLSADWWFSEWKTFDLENCNRTINTFYELRVAFCLFVRPFVCSSLVLVLLKVCGF